MYLIRLQNRKTGEIEEREFNTWEEAEEWLETNPKYILFGETVLHPNEK